jgi:hypothetical protein
MDKKQAALKILTDKELIEPLPYLMDDYKAKTGLTPEKYFQIRHELAKRNNNRKQAEEAHEYFNVFYRE